MIPSFEDIIIMTCMYYWKWGPLNRYIVVVNTTWSHKPFTSQAVCPLKRPSKGGSLVALSHPSVYLCHLTSGGNCRCHFSVQIHMSRTVKSWKSCRRRRKKSAVVPLSKWKVDCRFSQIVAPFMSTSVGCRYFSNKLSPHFDAMSLAAQTPWKASLNNCIRTVEMLGSWYYC